MKIPGRTFYRNSGKTSKEGYELQIIGVLINKLNYTLSYTNSNFRFRDYEVDDKNLRGNFLPLISRNNFYFELKRLICLESICL